MAALEEEEEVEEEVIFSAKYQKCQRLDCGGFTYKYTNMNIKGGGFNSGGGGGGGFNSGGGGGLMPYRCLCNLS